MTVLIPLGPNEHAPKAGPSRSCTPRSKLTFAFASPGSDYVADLERLLDVVSEARRIVVITGAGISTAAAIPDFRSATGLFGPPKDKDKGPEGREKEPSVRDLFHVAALKARAGYIWDESPRLLLKHHELITRLAVAALSAEPTPFHRLLAQLDERKSLLRCYTQNIDGLEAKAGLSVGISAKSPSTPRKRKALHAELSNPFLLTPPPSQSASTASPCPVVDDVQEQDGLKRVLPLHGTLATLYCPLCKHLEPIGPYLPDLALADEPPPCPSCSSESYVRRALFERPRRAGSLRPSVVLYGEDHPQAERIGEIVHLDTGGRGKEAEGRVDLLLVAGTTLAVPGVRRMIGEMRRALEPRAKGSPRRGRDAQGESRAIRTVFVNNEPPQKPSAWKDTFDVFVQGDVQDFARLMSERLARAESTESVVPPTPISVKKRKPDPAKGSETPVSTKKRKAVFAGHPESPVSPTSKLTRPRETPTKQPLPPTPCDSKPKPARKRAQRTWKRAPPVTKSATRTAVVGDTNPFLLSL